MSIVFEIRARIDPGKANLLESIRDTGSISAAAGDIGMTHIRAACCSTAPTLPVFRRMLSPRKWAGAA
jgi:hypothetical protein